MFENSKEKLAVLLRLLFVLFSTLFRKTINKLENMIKCNYYVIAFNKKNFFSDLKKLHFFMYLVS